MVGSVVRTCRQQARDPHAVITALLRSPVPRVPPCRSRLTMPHAGERRDARGASPYQGARRC
jgi:hypothetical protein